MKQPNTKKRVSRKQQLLSLQVAEYIERYHPEMRGSEVDISSCGTFASVRKVPKTDQP